MIARQLISKCIHAKSVVNFHSFQDGHQLFVQIPQPNFDYLNHSMLDLLHQNRAFQALEIFKKQIREVGVTHVDEVSIALATKACRGDPKLGCQIHGFALTSGLDSFLSVSNSLMHMYSKAGQIDRAIVIFEKLTNPDIASWNTLLSWIDNSNDALSFACRMNHIGITFDAVTYTSALAHCADCEEFLFGILLHSLVLKTGMQSEGFIANALIALYSKWERIVDAEKVFDEMPMKDLVSWNAMLSGFSQEGSYGEQAFTGRLEADEGLMRRIPGRVGNGIGIPVLQSLLGNCKVYGDMEVGEVLLKMEPTKSGSYVLLSNLYAEMGEWDEVARIRKSMKERDVKKVVGLSWVDVCGYASTHVFSSNDMSHPRMVEIYWMVGVLGG